jgi:hypothetical protein
MSTENPVSPRQHDPWNKGRLIGQKRPLKPKDVWTIRVRLQLEGRKRDLAKASVKRCAHQIPSATDRRSDG